MKLSKAEEIKQNNIMQIKRSVALNILKEEDALENEARIERSKQYMK